jgi:eukaryotic-like serine/threonine-protein kinase
MNPVEGAVLSDRYALTERIAGGGMGEVWAATDTVLDRTVAVKLLNPALSQESGFVERFRAEARHSAALHHPNITTVFDYDEDGTTAYLVMELVAGQPLSQIISERAPFSAHETSSILIQAASALEAAHRGGVVHRDVKPANILITPDGTAKLTDFGISRAVDAAPLTQTGQILGTAQYLSPEQALGHSATASSDIYALGVVGYEMLTGERPFEADTIVATAIAHINQPPPPLPDTVPAGVADVISACLAKAPANRPRSAAAVAHALGMLDAAVASAAPAGPASALTLPTRTQIMPAVAMPTQAMPTQAMPTQPMPTGPAGIPDRRAQRHPAWLLAAATVTVLGVLVVFALTDGSGSKTPVATAPTSSTSTSSSATPTSASRLTSGTAALAPPAITSPRPGRLHKGRGNGHDHKRDGK